MFKEEATSIFIQNGETPPNQESECGHCGQDTVGGVEPLKGRAQCWRGPQEKKRPWSWRLSVTQRALQLNCASHRWCVLSLCMLLGCDFILMLVFILISPSSDFLHLFFSPTCLKSDGGCQPSPWLPSKLLYHLQSFLCNTEFVLLWNLGREKHIFWPESRIT